MLVGLWLQSAASVSLPSSEWTQASGRVVPERYGRFLLQGVTFFRFAPPRLLNNHIVGRTHPLPITNKDPPFLPRSHPCV